MEDNNMLSVQLDLTRGAYIISRDNGKEEVVKEINSGSYDKVAMNKRRKEIESMESTSKWIPSDLLKLVDPILYDALEEFDNKYGTSYRSSYVKAITLQVPATTVSELKKKRQYQKRVLGLRQEALEKAGISMEYDINMLGKANGLGLADKIQALKTANAQKTVGATIKVKQSDFIMEKIKGVGSAISKGISGIQDKITERRMARSAKKLQLAQKRLEEAIPRDENGLIDDIPELSEEELAAISSSTLAQTGQVVDIGSNVKDGPEINPIAIGTASENKVVAKGETTGKNFVAVDVVEPKSNVQSADSKIEATNPSVKSGVSVGVNASTVQMGETVLRPELEARSNPNSGAVIVEELETAEVKKKVAKAEQGEAQQTKKKRNKARQEAKRAAREAGKIKNSYRGIIQAKETAKINAEQRRQAAAIKKEEDDRKAAQEEEERLAREKEEQIRREIAAAEERLAAEEAERLLNERKLSVRFTRKLKSAQDSIRNKVHIPKLTKPQRQIAGVIAAVALVGAIGVAVTTNKANAGATEKVPTEPTAPVVEAMESTRPEFKDLEQLGYVIGAGQKENLGIKDQTPEAPPQVDNGTDQKSEEEARKEYLSSIKVGSNMKIENGKYFASPDGTGNFGLFENYTDGVKELTIIDVITKDGVIVVKDPNVSLYDLKQQYPDAKFSYHFVFRHTDGRTTTLGWYTENSIEQNIEMQNNVQAMSDEGR